MERNKSDINTFFDGMRLGADRGFHSKPGRGMAPILQAIENERQEALSELARKPTETPGRFMYTLQEALEAVSLYFDAKEGEGKKTACMIRLIKPIDLEEFL